MSKSEIVLRDFVYLDWERVRSLAAQLFRGVPQDATIEKSKGTTVNSEIEGGFLNFLKGAVGADYRYLRTENETRSLHHYVYSLVEEELTKNSLYTSIDAGFDFKSWTTNLFRDGQFVRVRGTVRFIDYGWTTTMIKALPGIMTVAVNMANLDLQKKDKTSKQITEMKQPQKENEQILKEIKTLKLDQVADLIRSLYGDVIRIKVVPSKDFPRNLFVGSGIQGNFHDSTASLSQKYGYEVDAGWITLGQINFSDAQTEPMPIPIGNQMEDGLEQAILGLNSMMRIASSPKFPAVSFTPISVYRLLK
jgi:hypothetical protein